MVQGVTSSILSDHNHVTGLVIVKGEEGSTSGVEGSMLYNMLSHHIVYMSPFYSYCVGR